MPAHLSEGWRRLGWTVEEFFYGTHMGKSWTPEGLRQNHAMNRQLLEKAKQLKAEGRLDLIFAVIYDDVLEVETARALKSLGAPMVNYHVDLVGQWQRVLRTGRYFDRVACAQKDHWDALRRAGIRPYYMPMAANPIRHPLRSLAGEPSLMDPRPKAAGDDEFKFDGVLYLGSPWEYRTQVLSALAKEGLPLRIYGNGWRANAAQKFNFQPWQKTVHDLRYYAFPFVREEGIGPVVETLSRRFRRQTANEVPVNQIPADCISGSYGDDDFAPLVSGASVNIGFSYFKGVPGSPGEQRQARLRDFEIPMAGGFYLAQDCVQLRELFGDRLEATLWNSVDGLIEKARYYLERPAERRDLATETRDYCEKYHSWKMRFQDLLSELGISQAVIPAKADTQNKGLGPDFRRGDDVAKRSECPACGSPAAASRRLFSVPFLSSSCSVLRCACSLVYKDRAPGAAALKSLYSKGYVHFQDQSDLVGLAEIHSVRQKLARCRRLLRGRPPEGGWRLLDVGCGAGSFVSLARKQGFAAEGLDAFLPEGLENSHLHRGHLDQLAPGSFDIVTLLNVAEHVVDPAPLFAGIRRILRPGGVLLLNCPYGNSLALRVHRARWIHMGLDEHLLFWTPASLTRLLKPLGFDGPISYRIAGSPFPFGRNPAPSPSRETKTGEEHRLNTPLRPSLWQIAQAGAWRAARAIQRCAWTAGGVRALVHLTRSGDYLEFAIGRGT